MKARVTVWITALLLGASAAGCSGSAPEQSSADVLRRLEMRITALEGAETQAAPRTERNRLPSGPAALRVASMRAAPRVTLPANPAAAVGQAAERQGLRDRLKRTDAEGANAVRVQIEDAPFAALMAWLAELQQQSGLRAESATLERGANPGTVNGRLLLRGQAA